eukprot:GHVH01001552.1.p1 GENE.GHVH01001552.1~~GHVH01001552.1.p1  ORF type:complete len:241 (+),score=25.55 GHVH01001552.1:229-951(+)
MENSSNYDCIHYAGLTPTVIPLGFVSGRFLGMAGTLDDDSLLEKITAPAYDVINLMYDGDTVVEIGDGNFGSVEFLGRPLSCGEWFIGDLPLEIDPNDGSKKDGIVMNFSFADSMQDKLQCYPFLPNDIAKLFPIWSTGNRYPVTQFTDLLRLVGVDEETGEPILLGRTFVNGPVGDATTGWWFVLQPSDKSMLTPSIIADLATITVDEEVNYSRTPLLSILVNANPLSGLVSWLQSTIE